MRCIQMCFRDSTIFIKYRRMKRANVGVGMLSWSHRLDDNSVALIGGLKQYCGLALRRSCPYVIHPPVVSMCLYLYLLNAAFGKWDWILLECNCCFPTIDAISTHARAISPADYQSDWSDWIKPSCNFTLWGMHGSWMLFIAGGQRILGGVTGTNSKALYRLNTWDWFSCTEIEPTWIHIDIM